MSIQPSNSNIQLCNTEAIAQREPKGIKYTPSPYSLSDLFWFVINGLLNSFFSYRNPDKADMELLAPEGAIQRIEKSEAKGTDLKVIFLGDIMLSKSGKPPEMTEELKRVIRGADVVIANVESPVIEGEAEGRGLSLKFEMSASFLKEIHDVNPDAQWAFSVANNHACDNSKNDVEGVVQTAKAIKNLMPKAQVIGAEVEGASSVLTLKKDELEVGVVGWTELMNHDWKHYKKPIVRETDLTTAKVQEMKEKHDFLIGFAHGNVEQDLEPRKETRDRWVNLIEEGGFDVIVGHGPHTAMPAEHVDKGLLFHSIGNFCSPDAPWPFNRPQTRVGMIPQITIHAEGKKVTTLEHKVHILEQQGDTVTVLNDFAESHFPKVSARVETLLDL